MYYIAGVVQILSTMDWAGENAVDRLQLIALLLLVSVVESGQALSDVLVGSLIFISAVVMKESILCSDWRLWSSKGSRGRKLVPVHRRENSCQMDSSRGELMLYHNLISVINVSLYRLCSIDTSRVPVMCGAMEWWCLKSGLSATGHSMLAQWRKM